MKFRHKIERIDINGHHDAASNMFVLDAATIGRSRTAHVRLQDRSVAIHHAKVTLEGETLIIENIDPNAQTKVNRRPIKRAAVRAGDIVQVGNVSLTVFFDKTFWGLHEIRDERLSSASKENLEKAVRSLDLARFYPSYLSLSLLAVVLIFLFGFVEPLTGYAVQRWSAGPISNPHLMFENDCSACHGESFTRVKDESCLQCHRMSDHVQEDRFKKVHLIDKAAQCVDCHSEHEGARGTTKPNDKLCITCHSREELHLGTGARRAVHSLAKHPEFAVITTPSENVDEVKRTPLDAIPTPRFPSTLKFNHEVHLKEPLRSRTEKKKLQCASCHTLRNDKMLFEFITFERNCQECHALTFDDSLPNVEVPHGEPNAVFPFLYAEYAKLLLANPSPEPEDVRRRPGEIKNKDDLKRVFEQQNATQQARDAEKVVFAKTGCQLCHVVNEEEPKEAGESRYKVVPANIPGRWMPAARFSHGTHTAVNCLECHPGTHASKSADDINLSRLSTCLKCHAAHGGNGKVESSCISCHSYHEPLQLLDNQKRLIEDIRRTEPSVTQIFRRRTASQ